jgi:hypothetical protein
VRPLLVLALSLAASGCTDAPGRRPPLGPPDPIAGGDGVPASDGAKAGGTSDADPLRRSLLGSEAPELATDGTWIAPAPADTLRGMRGQVVFLQFAFLGCEACTLVDPFVRRWHDAYGPQGFVVVDVDNGLMDAIDAARKGFRERGTPYAVFHDTSGATVKAYAIRGFPSAYLVGRDGKVVWEGNPMGAETALEERIREAVR